MVTLKEFLRIFEGTSFQEKELRRFYHAVHKAVILQLLGKISWSELLRLQDRCLWPVLQRLDDPTLPIYRGADKELLALFIGSIRREKEVRASKSGGKGSHWNHLQTVLNERTELYKSIFDFSKRDISHCIKAAERYRVMQEGLRRRRRRAWQIAIGSGAATIAGAAALWHLSKDKK
jgi:hypothetical protein